MGSTFFMHKDYERDNETCQSRAKQDVNDVRSSFCFCTADLIFHMCLESVTHNDNVENLLLQKVINQAGGRGEGKLYGKRRRTAERV